MRKKEWVLMIAAAVFTIITTAIVLFVFGGMGYCVLFRSPKALMSEYYGEEFKQISRKKVSTFDDMTIYTFRDSKGTECHAVYAEDYRADRSRPRIHRTYDDYRVKQQEQTPAVQRLLASKYFDVSYETNLGIEPAYGNIYPYCRWVIQVNSADEIPAALHLALDTVTAEDSRLPEYEFWRSDIWGSIAPTVMLGANLCELSFDDAEEYDYDALLQAAQERYAAQNLQDGEAASGFEDAI